MDAEEMIRILEEIIRDPDTNATARCTAIRTLREIPEPPAADAFADLDVDVPLRRGRAHRANNNWVALGCIIEGVIQAEAAEQARNN